MQLFALGGFCYPGHMDGPVEVMATSAGLTPADTSVASLCEAGRLRRSEMIKHKFDHFSRYPRRSILVGSTTPGTKINPSVLGGFIFE